jgi:kynurenine formamidase
MTTFPVHWHPMVEISIMGRHGLENRETRKILVGTHTGTHCDAPLHFFPGGMAVDELDLDVLVGEALVLDLSDLPPKREVGIDTLRERLRDRTPQRLILRFDWSDHWGSIGFYNDHPYLSEEVTRWLVSQGLRLLALDTPMPDDPRNGRGSPNDSPNHKTLLNSGVVLVEYLCNLRALASETVQLIVMPMKIAGADGAPARCVAIENWETQ